MKRVLIILSILLLCSGIVCAQEASEIPSTSGNAYLRICSAIEKDNGVKTQDELRHIISCAAYTSGVVDGVKAEEAFQRVYIGKSHTSPFCVPDAADNGQMIRITLKYIRNNPEEAHKTTVILIVEALREAFSCLAPAAKK